MESQGQRTTFLVEHYRPDVDAGQLGRSLASLREAIRDLDRGGNPLRLMCSVIVPDDESLLVVIQSGSAELVREALARADIATGRISEAIAEIADPSAPPSPPVNLDLGSQRV